ncbi:MAG: SAM-dependent methyltransferase [Opitutus sp.]
MTTAPARDRFLAQLRDAVRAGTLLKLTLGKHRGTDLTLHNLFVRPVALKSGPQLAFVWRHATRDITKNHAPDAALIELERLIGGDFLDAHLFFAGGHAQLETRTGAQSRLKVTRDPAAATAPRPATHDRAKHHLISPTAPWLHALGVTIESGRPREGMADKFRQIQKFAEVLSHLMEEAGLPDRGTGAPRLQVADMGCGKGYLTFAVAELLRGHADVRGIEARPELVGLCNRVAADHGLAPHLTFTAGSIVSTAIEACDVLIALHACDTATDDALAHGISAGARLMVVAPCCQKELRPQLSAPPVFAGSLRHGIFQERHAEFATDALRALLMEWAGFRTKVFEFISTEHTAKNLMIAAIRTEAPSPDRERIAGDIRDLARFYGIRTQALAAHLKFPLTT